MFDIPTTLPAVFGLVFVVGTMLAMRRRLRQKAIVQPHQELPLVLMDLLANFIQVPAVIIWLGPIAPLVTWIFLSISAGEWGRKGAEEATSAVKEVT